MTPDDLLAWYDEVRRDLPWRRTHDPWAIWVSEVMLQQTRVESAGPYYARFLARFPTAGSLAEAAEEEALALWSGLGYYGRCRALCRAAREVVARGGIPERASELQTLPGVGPYTAAAIASIAFGEAIPVLDGNVERVLSRRLGLDSGARTARGRARLLAAAAALLSEGRPGDSNQALMEVGATVCLPRAPRCSACPLADGCLARQRGDPERFPAPRPRRSAEEIAAIAFWIERGGRVLLLRRPSGAAQLAGLWELPSAEGDTRSAELAVAGRIGGGLVAGEELGRITHTITHRRFRIRALRATWSPDTATVAESDEAAWIDPRPKEQRFGLPLAGATRKILARFGGSGV